MYVDYRESVCAPLIREGCYPHQLAEDALVRAHCRPGMLVYDLGANIGWYTTLLSELGCRVVAVEPAPRALRLLLPTVGGRRTVEVIDRAVGATCGPCQVQEHWQLDRSTVTRGHGAQYGRPEFIKLDVEGSELATLTGGRHTLRAHRPPILFEHLPTTPYPLAAIAIELSLAGYRPLTRVNQTHNYFADAA